MRDRRDPWSGGGVSGAPGASTSCDPQREVVSGEFYINAPVTIALGATVAGYPSADLVVDQNRVTDAGVVSPIDGTVNLYAVANGIRVLAASGVLASGNSAPLRISASSRGVSRWEAEFVCSSVTVGERGTLYYALVTYAGAAGGGGAAAVAPTGTGTIHVVAGVQDLAASLVVDADVAAAAAIAGSKVSPNFGAQNVTTTGAIQGGNIDRSAAGAWAIGGTNAAAISLGRSGQNVAALGSVTVAGTISAGTTPATLTGTLRLPTGAGVGVGFKNGSADCAALETLSGTVYLNDGSASATGVHIRPGTGQISHLCAQAAHNLDVDNVSVRTAIPIVGDGSTSPYAANGGVMVMSVTGSLTAGQYKYDQIVFTGTPGATQTMTFPNPSTLAGAYSKKIRNASASSVIVTTGAGATVTIPTLQSALVAFENGNTYAIGAVAAY